MSTCEPIITDYYKFSYNNTIVTDDYMSFDFENHLIKSPPINQIKQPNFSSNYTSEDFKGEKGLKLIEIMLGYGVTNTKLRCELRRLIHAIVIDDILLNFFMTKSPPENTGYVFWDCPEMTKVKSLFTCDDETLFTFGFKCRALQLFFSNPSLFYKKFSQS
jgi:hypothetical protein